MLLMLCLLLCVLLLLLFSLFNVYPRHAAPPSKLPYYTQSPEREVCCYLDSPLQDPAGLPSNCYLLYTPFTFLLTPTPLLGLSPPPPPLPRIAIINSWKTLEREKYSELDPSPQDPAGLRRGGAIVASPTGRAGSLHCASSRSVRVFPDLAGSADQGGGNPFAPLHQDHKSLQEVSWRGGGQKTKKTETKKKTV